MKIKQQDAPTLTMTTPEGKVIDQQFTYVPMTDVPFYNCDVYIDEEWQREPSLHEMSLEDVRKWWKTLVKKGYTRKLEEQGVLDDSINA